MKMVPTNRLLISVGVVFLPLTLWIALMPANMTVVFTIITGFVMLVLVDAAKSRGQLVGIRIELPEVVRLSKDRAGDIEVRIENDDLQVKRLRLGLPFPTEIDTPSADMWTVLPEEATLSNLRWPCTALKQGYYILDRCYLETSSAMGFWAVRSSVPARSELRVYPNLMGEHRNLSALFLNRGFGVHSQRQVGKGREFEQLREYIPGDSYEDIHWKATAKRSEPITKVYQIERTQQVYMVIDASRLSARTLKVHRKNDAEAEPDEDRFAATILERYVSASLIMGLAAERQGDLYGMLTFDDRVRAFVSAKNGKNHYNTCRDALFTLQPQRVSPDFSELFSFICTRIRRRSLLVFLTHLDDAVLAENFARHIDLISRKHLVLVITLKPAGATPIFSSPRISSTDEIYKNLGGHLIWKHLRETEKILQRKGIGVAVMENEKLCAELVSKYLGIKQRQVL